MRQTIEQHLQVVSVHVLLTHFDKSYKTRQFYLIVNFAIDITNKILLKSPYHLRNKIAKTDRYANKFYHLRYESLAFPNPGDLI